MSRLTLFLLGPPRIERDGAPVKLSRRKAVALLAYLAVTGQSHSRDALATQFWPEFDQSRARASLRNVLADLKKALGEGWLDIDQETVRLYGEAEVWLDVVEFQDRLAECRTHDHPPDQACPACLPLLTNAATLYRDDFLAGFTLRDSPGFDEWQFFQTEGLRHELASVLERLARWHGAQGEYEPAIAYARRWVVLDPLHEPAHCCLMRLYARSGQHAAAWRQYRECVRVLEEELGVPPSDETTALHERIRAERVRPPERKAVPLAPTPLPPIPPPLPAFLTEGSEPVAVERSVFVARERELARLNGHLEASLAGQGQVVLITGGPGRGKTALMREFARRSMETYPDLLVAGGNCNAYSGIGDPYLPFREVMAMLTGDVEARWAAGTIAHDHARRLWAALPLAAQALVDRGPSLIDAVLPGPALLSRAAAAVSEGASWLGQLKALVGREKAGYSDLEQRALFEQLTNVLRTLAEVHPLLLTLDDVQWADNGSISLLFHLGRRLEGGRILIVCAYRPAEVAGGRHGERHPLESVLTEFKRRFGDVWVNLRQADETEGRRFVDAFLDTEPNRLGEDFRRGLFHHTGGHPLFTIELLRAMQARGDLIQDEGGRWAVTPALDWRTLPVRVEAAIEARIGWLSDELREILAVASVEGERFTAQVVARVQGIPEREVLRALSQELERRYRLVGEEEEVQIDGRFLSRYRFAHALFQQYLYNELSAGERRLLHGEIGDALEEIYQHRSHDIAVQLTHHYAEAGRREKTIEYSLHAGDQARLAYANEEATDYYGRALALLDGPAPLSSRKDWRLEALQGLGQVCFGTSRVAEAEAFLREAITLGRETGLAPRELVRLYYWLGEVLFWQSRYDDRVHIGEEGLALLGDDTESVEAALMNQTIAGGLIGKENLAKCHEFTYRTAGFIRRLPYSEELRPAYIQTHSVYRQNKDIEKAMEWLQALEERATRCHDLRALGEVRFFTGFTLAVAGDLRGAVPRFQQALELFTRIGDVPHKSWSLLAMGRAFLSLGDRQKAEGYADGALEAAKAVRTKREIVLAYDLAGHISLCQGAWETAVNAFQEVVELLREISRPSMGTLVTYHLGQAHLARGDRVEAREQFRGAVALMGLEELRGYPSQPIFTIIPHPFIAGALSGLEEAYEDPEAFRAFCDRCRSQAGEGPFIQWYLEPAEPRQDFGLPILDFGLGADDFENLLSGAEGACPERGRPSDAEGSKIQNREWVWQDPFGDGSFRVRNGLEIHAANGRDLQYLNLSAPRMLWPASGDWTVQTVCAPASGKKPAIGGLVLWKDKENYLHLDRGATGEHEILFAGCLGNQDIVIGRGRLRESADQQIVKSPGRVFLRLEWIGDRVDALCSADGENWFTVGGVAFPVEDPVQVGLHAIGNIDRAVYRGAHPDGTAIRFESFQLRALNR